MLLLLLVLTFIGAVKIKRGAVELNRLMQVVSRHLISKYHLGFMTLMNKITKSCLFLFKFWLFYYNYIIYNTFQRNDTIM